jgi:hypothetical protein
MYMYDSVDNLERSARRWRRRAVARGEYLSAKVFCRRRRVSMGRLRTLMHQGDVFDVAIANRRYYPTVLTSVRGVRLSRLDRLCRQLAPLPTWHRYDALTSAKGSLGGKSVLQLLGRGAGYRRARWYARAVIEEN